VAVGIETLERRVAGFIMTFHDGDAVGVRAVHQRAHASGSGGAEAGVQERVRRFELLSRVQRKVDPVALQTMTVPSGYFWAVAGSKPK
jgi:hypothetical protein